MQFYLAVKGIIRRDDGRILLVKRSSDDNYYPGYWETVGGKVEEMDLPQNELKREIKEETNLNVEVVEPFNVFGFETKDKLGITFICDYLSGEVVLSHEHEDFQWIDPVEIDKYKTSEGILMEIKKYQEKYGKK